jgi:hypothetical protein
MAGPNYVLDKGFIVDAAAPQFALVKLVSGAAGADHVTPCTAATDLAIGVLQQAVVTADIGKQVAEVRILGITKAIAEGVSNAGDMVDVGATTFTRVTTTTTAAARTVGIVVSTGSGAASAAGDLIDVLLIPGSQYGT